VTAAPLQDGAEQVVLARGHRVVDELRLPAVAVRRHHHVPGQRVGRGGPPLAADQVQQGVDAGRGAGAGEDLAGVDVEHRRVDGHGRVPGGQLSGVAPVSRGAAAVEQTGVGEHERAGALADDDRAAGVGGAQRRHQLW
jgi:hypothetical protein